MEDQDDLFLIVAQEVGDDGEATPGVCCSEVEAAFEEALDHVEDDPGAGYTNMLEVVVRG